MEPMMTTEDIAKVLRVDPGTVLDNRKAWGLDGIMVRVGRQYLAKRTDLESWFAQRASA